MTTRAQRSGNAKINKTRSPPFGEEDMETNYSPHIATEPSEIGLECRATQNKRSQQEGVE